MPLFYADASALVKLVGDEPETAGLRSFVADSDLVSSELVLTEIPRAVRRACAHDKRLPLDALIARAGDLLDAVALLAVDRAILAAAGAAPLGRLVVGPARRAGLRTVSPPG